MKKHIERICANCKLFNPARNECSVVILWEGQRRRLPVDPQDPCFFEGQYFDPNLDAFEDFAGEIQEVKMWVEDKEGNRVKGEGTVKIEYPEGFLGDATIDEIVC